MKRFRLLILIVLFFALMYTLRGYVNPVKNNILGEFSSRIGGEFDNTFATSSENTSSSTASSTLKELKVVGPKNINRDKLSPVVGKSTASNKEDLTQGGIISYTNLERLNNGLYELRKSQDLDSSASIKLNDMFTNQYFEHVSPKGSSVSDVVNGVGYSFLIVGENLALGDFGGDSQVVKAWMESPGHRANILDKRYTEIGVAVGYGMYNGKMQWIAVQHFGRPMSSCPSPSPNLKTDITLDKDMLTKMEDDLINIKKKLDSIESTDSNFMPVVSSYNALVIDYNNRLKKLKSEIATYNEEVQTFNNCLDAVTASSAN